MENYTVYFRDTQNKSIIIKFSDRGYEMKS